MELAKHCGKDDIVTPTGDEPGQNCDGWRRHETAQEIKRKLGEDIWNEYFVFAIERNPWDKVLSNYWSRRGYEHGKGGATEATPWIERVWRKTSGYPWSFETWIRYRLWYSRLTGFRKMRFPKAFGNYTDSAGAVIVNFLGRYEHYSDHLKVLSGKLGFPLNLKSREGRDTRKDRRTPDKVYSDWSANLIENIYTEELQLLDYEFGKPAPASYLLDGEFSC